MIKNFLFGTDGGEESRLGLTFFVNIWRKVEKGLYFFFICGKIDSSEIIRNTR